MKKQVKEIKQYYCTCEADCIHKKGTVKRTVVTRPYSVETIKTTDARIHPRTATVHTEGGSEDEIERPL